MQENIRAVTKINKGVRIGGIKFKRKPTQEELDAKKLSNKVKVFMKKMNPLNLVKKKKK